VDLLSFWASYNGSLLFSPIVALAATRLGKPWQVRRFGSGVRNTWLEMGAWEKLLTISLFHRADQILLQTKSAVEMMKRIFPDAAVHWHGNFRPIPKMQRSAKDLCRRFVFLGEVISEKGIGEIIESAERFPDGAIEVDLYGPLTGEYTEGDLQDVPNVNYCGIASMDSIPGLLTKSDALLLPTRFSREGYPGVILEAYMAGIPVIVSDFPSLNEIVDSTSGILIPPGDTEELYQAIRLLVTKPDVYQEMANGAYRKRELFSLQSGINLFLELCRKVIDSQQRSD
jgi:glycosyltransferase involved in cell wall biosynthesis